MGSKRIRNWKTTGCPGLTFAQQAEQCAIVCVVFFSLLNPINKNLLQRGKKCLPSNLLQLKIIWHSFLTLSTVWGLHLQTETVSVLAARTSALECQPYIILESSGACGIWPLGAKYNTLLRWFGSRAWREHHVRLEEISARDTSALRSVSPHTHGPLPQASARLTLLLSPCRLLWKCFGAASSLPEKAIHVCLSALTPEMVGVTPEEF